MSSDDLRAGQTIKQGQLILLTSGEYSDFGIEGLYRAKCDFVIPGKQARWTQIGVMEADTAAISINVEWVEEVEYVTLWRDA